MNRQESALPAVTAQEEYTALRQLRDALETGYATGGGFEFEEPEYHVADLPNGHTLIAVDISNQPGGAFKYVSAWGGLAGLPESTGSVVTASAGNYSKTLAHALKDFGLHGTAFTPRDLNPVKRQGMLDAGMDVVAEFDDVGQAVSAAEAWAAATEGVEFLHPYDNRWGIAALTKLGGYVLGVMEKLGANGDVDMSGTVETCILSPIGGGSLTSAVASELYRQRSSGDIGDSVSLRGVRPQRVAGGELDNRFDGLRVDVPGSHARPLLEDNRFVQGTVTVPATAVADATRRMKGLSSAHYEPNALVSVAAAAKWAVDHPGEAPKNFVALLTGRNVDQSQYQEFMAMPGYEGSEAHERYLADRTRRLGALTVWNGFRATAQISYAPAPTDPSRRPGSGCLNGGTIRAYIAK